MITGVVYAKVPEEAGMTLIQSLQKRHHGMMEVGTTLTRRAPAKENLRRVIEPGPIQGRLPLETELIEGRKTGLQLLQGEIFKRRKIKSERST